MPRSRVDRAWAILAGLLVLSVAAPATAQTADNVLLVVNDASAPSAEIGAYYARQRQLALDHVVHLRTLETDGIVRRDYERQIEGPIGAWLLAHRLQDRVLFIVLTKGVPLRVEGTGGLNGTVASVDSELTLLYERLVGLRPAVVGRVANPYYLGDAAISTAQPFTRRTAETYLVTRLDGFTVDEVLKLIDRGMSPSRDGKIVLDERGTVIDRGGDQWLAEAAARVGQAAGTDRAVLGTTSAVAATNGPVLGYYSWGSNDAAIRARRTGL